MSRTGHKLHLFLGSVAGKHIVDCKRRPCFGHEVFLSIRGGLVLSYDKPNG